MVELSPNAMTVLTKRYLLKDAQGKTIETPEQLFTRVAKHVAQAEANYSPTEQTSMEDKFYNMMASLDFLPNSPTLMNAGKNNMCLSGCFVVPIADSMDSIMDGAKLAAMIHKAGGGTGFSFSNLRPEGDVVGTTGGVASGPISFMKIYDTVTEVVKQGGSRRGANMGILRIDHPDAIKFIQCKDDGKSFSNFNLSIALTNLFMSAVAENSRFNLINPKTGLTTNSIMARELFNLIVEHAWKTGDPGIIFIDRIDAGNPTPEFGHIEATNPCGEQPLLPYESCNLGSINLANFANGGDIDFDGIGDIVHLAARFLDDVIDTNHFPDPRITEATLRTRKIGLGVMGWADMLIESGIPYDSQEALDFAEELMGFINYQALEASVSLGSKRGGFFTPIGVRNAARTTIAPTGTLSIIANCSSGIEPIFAVAYTRTVLEGTKMAEMNPAFLKKFSDSHIPPSKVIANNGSIRGLGFDKETESVFVTAHEIAPEWHVKMQAAFQKHTDNAVSKTVNFPNTATKEDVAKVYQMAYDLGCKGITIYRDGSKENQVLSTSSTPKPQVVTPGPRKRPLRVQGFTDKIVTGCGNMYVTVNVDDKGPCEVFVHLGKSGACACAQLEGTCRMISLALRSGVALDNVVEQLKGIRCPSVRWEGDHPILSCGDAIAKVLSKELSEAEIKKVEVKAVQGNTGGQCPDCSGALLYQEGCYSCASRCGYTKCG